MRCKWIEGTLRIIALLSVTSLSFPPIPLAMLRQGVLCPSHSQEIYAARFSCAGFKFLTVAGKAPSLVTEDVQARQDEEQTRNQAIIRVMLLACPNDFSP